MRNWLVALVVLAGCCSFVPLGFAQEEEGLLSKSGFEVSGDLAICTQYVWRGILLDRDMVMQPGFYITSPESKLGRIKAGVWSSQDVQNRDNLHSQELDYIFDYTYAFEKFSLSAGHTYYDFPDSDLNSREFYTGVSLSAVPLSPSLYFYYDYGDESDGGGDGSYTVLNLSHSIPIKNTAFTLDLGGHIGYNHGLFIRGNGGDAGFKVGLTIPLTKNLSFGPSVNYTIPLADLRSKDDGAQKNRFYGAFSFAYVF
ncbi:MAG: hypothetical protein PHJ00_04465 [Candidatus Omnitrophica bacterium]|nr:hypothetical protein [Candidatus Omnitrophota bacterium]MDD5655431.1 hypothetical protein [Candidatus Omnitrophota bacterium]